MKNMLGLSMLLTSWLKVPPQRKKIANRLWISFALLRWSTNCIIFVSQCLVSKFLKQRCLVLWHEFFLYRRLFTPGTGPNKHYNCIYKRLIVYLSNNCSHTRQSRVFLLIIKLHVCHPKFPFKQSVCYVKIKQNG